MQPTSKVRVYIACSLDGFIAGTDDDLCWLPGAGPESGPADGPSDSGAVTYEGFMEDVGALLMGRRTYDVVAGFEGPWPYGESPVLVCTHRQLQDPAAPTVQTVSGDIESLVAQAKVAAKGKDVYVDGGALIRQLTDAGLIDEAIITFAPILLGEGRPLFAGLKRRHKVEIVAHHRFSGGMLQVQLRLEGL